VSILESTLSLATALLARRSLTPDDGGCLDLLTARLEPLGFVCERVDRNGITNLWARRGRSAPLVCIAGHLDVVPPGPEDRWTTPPFEPAIRSGRLFARGASDMKGPLAAAVTALERVVADYPGHPGSLAVLLTSDEEGVARDGTAAVVDVLSARGERIDACIVTEATCLERLGDSVKNGRRGSLNGVLTVRGHQAHIAYPHLGRNPVHLAAQAIADLTTEVWDAGDEYFPPTTFQISNIHAGTGADNVIPGDLQVAFNFRFCPVSPVETLKARLARILDRHSLEYTVEWRLSGLPFVTPRGRLVDIVVDVVRDVTGVRPALSTGGGTSDARFIAAVATEVIEFGPVNASIHQVDEHILIDDLEPLSRIYEVTVRRLLGLQDGP